MAALATALASAGCGPLAGVTEEALNPSLELGVCCRDVSPQQLAGIVDGPVRSLAPEGSRLVGGGYGVRVQAIATVRRLRPEAVAARSWESDTIVSDADEQHELVVALVTFAGAAPIPAAPGVSTPTSRPDDPFSVTGHATNGVAGYPEHVRLFTPHGSTSSTHSVVLVARVFVGASVSLSAPGARRNAPGIDLRTGQPPATGVSAPPAQ